MDEGGEPQTAGAIVVRGGVGGLLMGLANLVPGISGGTMLLAAGVYPQFVRAIAEVTTLKFRRDSLLVLGAVVVAAMAAIGLLAGPVRNVVVDHRWMAYSVFIGLTLGGVPVVWRLIQRGSSEVWAGAAGGFAAMAALALWQSGGGGEAGAAQAGFGMMVLAGVAGASAMILPGISGGYLLLVLGVYVAILGGIDDVKLALKARDFGALTDPMIGVVIPVGIGVVVGVVVVSNLIKWLLSRYERPTLGVLLGLLVGAVVGLWPFQKGVEPKVGDVVKGSALTEASLAELEAKDWPVETFSPGAGEVFGALGLVVVGFAATMGVARLSKPSD